MLIGLEKRKNEAMKLLERTSVAVSFNLSFEKASNTQKKNSRNAVSKALFTFKGNR